MHHRYVNVDITFTPEAAIPRRKRGYPCPVATLSADGRTNADFTKKARHVNAPYSSDVRAAPPKIRSMVGIALTLEKIASASQNAVRTAEAASAEALAAPTAMESMNALKEALTAYKLALNAASDALAASEAVAEFASTMAAAANGAQKTFMDAEGAANAAQSAADAAKAHAQTF